MIDPYRMVAVNMLASIIVATTLCLYFLFFKKKTTNYIFILLLLSILPLVSILRKGTYESGDLSLNVYKLIAFYQSLQEGIIIPQWGGNLNATYGYPVFIYNYPLPYYLAAFFHFIGFSLIHSVKLVLATTYVASGFAMYFWMKEELGKSAGFISAIFYLYAPYHLIDMHFRSTLGEMTAFVFLPLILLSTKKVITSNSGNWHFVLVFSLAALILSHQAISLISFPLITGYGIFVWFSQKEITIKKALSFFYSLSLGMLLSAFYWLPVITESTFTHQTRLAHIDFPAFLHFFYSPWRLGLLFQGPMGELSYVIGYMHWIIIIGSVILLLRKKLRKKETLLLTFFLIIFLVVFILMQSFTKPLWYVIPFMKNFQFAYRLLTITTLSSAVIAGVVLMQVTKKSMIAIILIVTMGSTILNWGNRKAVSAITDAHLRNDMPLSSIKGEGLYPAMPYWTNSQQPFMSQIPKKHLEPLKGKADILELKRTSIFHEYIVHAKTDVQLKEHTLYYPGWHIEVNDKPHLITYEDKKHLSSMLFNVKKGRYKIEVFFTDTPLRRFSKLLSLLTFIYLLLFIIYSNFYRSLFHRRK